MTATVRIKDQGASSGCIRAPALAAVIVIMLADRAGAAGCSGCRWCSYDYYAELSQGNRVRIEPLPPQRGIIWTAPGA